MHQVESARRIVEAAARPLPDEPVAAAAASGRWLARPLLAARPVPPYACSAMDGWAVRAADARAGAVLRASGRRVYAGDASGGSIGAGEATRVFTGAPLPGGADAVVREEQTVESAGTVALRQEVEPGENVRSPGEDVRAGEVALEAGARLGPRQLGLCAALGVAEVRVTARPRVALLSTGDEIARGLIPDSNRATLQADLEALGCRVEAAVVGDEPEALRAALEGAVSRADLVVTTAGVSVGEKDFVPRALERLGARIHVHGVAMKPGRPFLFATAGTTPVLGLPGSPSACLVAYEVFARPLVRALAGARATRRRELLLPLAAPVCGRPGRMRFLWADLTEDGRVRPLGEDVAQIRGPALAGALLALPEGTGELAQGAFAPAWLLEEGAP